MVETIVKLLNNFGDKPDLADSERRVDVSTWWLRTWDVAVEVLTSVVSSHVTLSDLVQRSRLEYRLTLTL